MGGWGWDKVNFDVSSYVIQNNTKKLEREIVKYPDACEGTYSKLLNPSAELLAQNYLPS